MWRDLGWHGSRSATASPRSDTESSDRPSDREGEVIKTHTFNNKRYKIILDDLDGNRDTDDHLWLIIERDLSKRVGLETAIHEALHACRWAAKEDEVTVTAKDIARFLWRLGFRKEK